MQFIETPVEGEVVFRKGEICPVCNKGKLQKGIEKELFSSYSFFRCGKCKSKWRKVGSDRFRLMTSKPETGYYNKTLSNYDWRHFSFFRLSFKDDKEKRKETAKQWLIDNLSEGRIPIEKESEILLQRNEVLHNYEDTVLYESTVVNKTRGNYYSYSIPMGKGMGSVRVGSYAGTSSYSHQEKSMICKGKIFLTNKRLIFQGTHKNLNIRLKNLISINILKDGIQINRDNKQKPEVFKVKDSLIWTSLISGAFLNNITGNEPKQIDYSMKKIDGSEYLHCPACIYPFFDLKEGINQCKMCGIESIDQTPQIESGHINKKNNFNQSQI
jgi:hypothetical protein